MEPLPQSVPLTMFQTAAHSRHTSINRPNTSNLQSVGQSSFSLGPANNPKKSLNDSRAQKYFFKLSSQGKKEANYLRDQRTSKIMEAVRNNQKSYIQEVQNKYLIEDSLMAKNTTGASSYEGSFEKTEEISRSGADLAGNNRGKANEIYLNTKPKRDKSVGQMTFQESRQQVEKHRRALSNPSLEVKNT